MVKKHPFHSSGLNSVWLSLLILVQLCTLTTYAELSEKDFTWESIQRVLSRQTRVTYSDGTTPIGSFYQDYHRKYMPLESMPKKLIQAVVASEDANFFKHNGVDYWGVVKAMGDNVLSLNFKRGGSSITQQTAKNLFADPADSKIKRLFQKFPELQHTYLLEKNLTKNQILEIYLNQFYVVGNGKGAGIAAEYFFSKDLSELSLIELAFIAGSVKGPNRYNPFISPSAQVRALKEKRSQERVEYVLSRMLELGYITKEEYQENIGKPVPFKKGAFRFQLSNQFVLVEKELEKKPFAQILQTYAKDGLYQSGLKIVTTLNADIQRRAEYELQRQLIELSFKFEGFHPPPQKNTTLLSHLTPGSFVNGVICSTLFQGKELIALQVQFGSTKGWIKQKEVQSFFHNISYFMNEPGDLSPEKKSAFIKKWFRVGKPLQVLISMPIRNEPVTLEIAQKPQINGGFQVVQSGKIIAHVGGFANEGYDRVDQAQRQFGSTFKPIVYAAALRLGWHPLDTLQNSRQLFVVGNTYYFPRPFSEGPSRVSLAWAGRNSDNVASVWLMYHLLDKKSPSDFWEVAKEIGIHPDAYGSEAGFASGVKNRLGFSLEGERWDELQYIMVTKDLAAEYQTQGKYRESEWIRSLPYGRGYEAEKARYKNKRNQEEISRYNILHHSYLRYVSELNANSNSTGTDLLGSLFGGSKTLDTVSVINQIKKALANNNHNSNDRYNPNYLQQSPEFRFLVASRYIQKFCKSLGINSSINPVLSFPLGANTITLAEAISAYSKLITGYSWSSKNLKNQMLLIKEIYTRDGKRIYQDTTINTLFLNPQEHLGNLSILREVITGGTAARINRELRVYSSGGSYGIPSFGKTGTTNDYRNGAFLGGMAVPQKGTGLFQTKDAYILGIYVGFDDNRQMSKSGFRGIGGTLSLTPWIETAKTILYTDKLIHRIDYSYPGLAESGKFSLQESQEFSATYSVDEKTGLLLRADSSGQSPYTFLTLQR